MRQLDLSSRSCESKLHGPESSYRDRREEPHARIGTTLVCRDCGAFIPEGADVF